MKWNVVQLFRRQRLKFKSSSERNQGFTLIELLVALILSTLVVGALLSFLLDLMNNDRREQAKSTSEQEVQSALDFIRRDLQQAVYIYDATGINAISSQLPGSTSTDTGATTTDRNIPVLVFWKRDIISGVVPVAGSTAKDDGYAYSLVAYYLIRDNNTSPWSGTARIGRFRIQGPVKDLYGSTVTDSRAASSAGFKLFDLSGSGTIAEKMNRWTKSSSSYTESINVLIDYVDQTLSSSSDRIATCPTGFQLSPSTGFDTSGGETSSGSLAKGFYACVSSDGAIPAAQVYIRGNALARLTTPANVVGTSTSSLYTYNTSRSSFFPAASVFVKGEGFLNPGDE